VAARKSSRKKPEAVQVDLGLDFGGAPPALTAGVPPVVSAFDSPAASLVAVVEEGRGAVRAREDGEEKSEVASGCRKGGGAAAVLTVTQLTKKVRRLLEQQLGHVWVEGELSNVRRQANGHAYFTLKDAGAQLSCVLFRGQVRPGMPLPEDGLHVQLGGEISVYEPRGQYQLIVSEMQVAGVGALQAKFEALKRRLAAEGLFDASRKRPLPSFPSCLAVVTSPTGAAVRDMLNILGRRAPWVRVVIFPVRVQGDGAAAEIASAVRRLGEAEKFGLPRPDVVIVARGGGSMEDLWCFNEEVVARALAECPIPTVSAVGHEIDFTIADFAADLRALTPSAAAELVVPDRSDLLRRVQALRRAFTAHTLEGLRHARTVVEFHSRGPLSREPRRLLAQGVQQVDDLAVELRQVAEAALRRRRDRVTTLGHRLAAQRPAHVLEQRRQLLAHLGMRLDAARARGLAAAGDRLQRVADLLRSLGPQAVLSRGYTMTLAPNGQALTRATQVRAGDRLTTRLADGTVESVVAAPRHIALPRERR
jgi:exodeoxyribonuclease VII large subunit